MWGPPRGVVRPPVRICDSPTPPPQAERVDIARQALDVFDSESQLLLTGAGGQEAERVEITDQYRVR